MCLCFLGRGTWRSWMVLLCFCCTSVGVVVMGWVCSLVSVGMDVDPETVAHVERAVWASTYQNPASRHRETAAQGLGCE